jgi:hypothetical protein
VAGQHGFAQALGGGDDAAVLVLQDAWDDPAVRLVDLGHEGCQLGQAHDGRLAGDPTVCHVAQVHGGAGDGVQQPVGVHVRLGLLDQPGTDLVDGAAQGGRLHLLHVPGQVGWQGSALDALGQVDGPADGGQLVALGQLAGHLHGVCCGAVLGEGGPQGQ